MKTKLLIVEDSHYKLFATKQVLVSQLHLDVSVCEVANSRELIERAESLNPDWIIFRPIGGLKLLIDKMKQRHVNRRNTEIMIAVASDLDAVATRCLQEIGSRDLKRFAQAA